MPPYLCYLAGTTFEHVLAREPNAQVARREIVAALLFVAGFSTVFVALGASASAIGGLLRAYSNFLSIVAGIAIIAMGLHFLGVFRIPLMARTARIEVEKPVGLWGAYVMGLAFAFGWTPCIGPVLAAILAVAASETTVASGASLLAVYSLGLGIPFVLAAFALEAVRGDARAHAPSPGAGRKGDGRDAGAHRHRLPHRLGDAGELSGCSRRFRCWRISADTKRKPAEAGFPIAMLRSISLSSSRAEFRRTCRPCPRCTRRNRGR